MKREALLFALGLSLCTHAAAAQPGAEEAPPPGSAEGGGAGAAGRAERRPTRRVRRPAHAAQRKRAERPRSARPQRRLRKRTAYDRLMEELHAPPAPELVERARSAPVRDLVFFVQGRSQPFVVTPSTPEGGYDELQLVVAKEAFGSWPKGPTPSPRLLDLIYAAVRHFDVPHVHLISGVRRDRRASRHSHGLAADVVLPGVTDEDLAAFFRAQGFVGVGVYPRSSFVHIDTRDQSFFWIDNSSPGRRGRVIPVRKDEAAAADEAALARGDGGFVNPPKLQRALRARAVRRRRGRAQPREHEVAAGEHETPFLGVY